MECDYKARRDNLRKILIEKNIDAMLVSYAANRYYLSGFELHDVQFNESSGYILVGSDGRDFLLTDPRYFDAVRKIFPENDIFIYTHDKESLLISCMRTLGHTIALEYDAVPAKFVQSLNEKKNALSFVSGSGFVEQLRVLKDSFEIECLEASFALNHTMLLWLEKELTEGSSETAIAWKIESFFRENGASELAFPSIVAINANAAQPHAVPGETIIRGNDLVLVDVGCRVNGYCSDQTRTFWIGDSPSENYLKTKSLVSEAQQAAIEYMRPGVALADVYKKARSIFEREGVEEAFTHGLGHGVGLETHEKPSFSPRSKGVLEPGMVVTVEPGLYYPSWGGIRIEHTVVVENDGVRIL